MVGFRPIFLTTSFRKAQKKERELERAGGDVLTTFGPIRLRGKTVAGYAVSLAIRERRKTLKSLSRNFNSGARRFL